ncbi:hypothetical protein R1T16_02980 [Flavobacterium sp. DG1-102-2]|uniref:hypothetical protein n=1 Tax=Flavobacterium sp. DG1-102-2 TaxID=3081663 RepID=UPI0029495D1F|nr:hypothetical protein [Flavobacterium sp. DG1-102-2]MDV6167372.1 hypothetical protein [Flavobacterium sp. DG1-102-2]
MKNKILIALNLLLFMSCTTNSLDLSTVDYNQDAGTYLDGLSSSSKTEQKGHYEADLKGEDASFKLVDKGEKLTNYVFMGEKNTAQLNYAGLAINDVMGTALSVYDNKIAFMRMHVKNDQSIALFETLKKKIGEPTDVVYNEGNNFDENDKSQKLLFDKLPKYTKKVKDDMLDEYYVTYPENFVWDKNDVIYQLTLSATGNYVDNQLVVISKKAFKDKVIMGYHNPAQDPILSKYIK